MRHALAIALATFALLAGGCARAPGQSEAGAFVASVERAHAEADRAIAEGDVGGARRALSAAFEHEAPGSIAAGDRRVLRQDLAYRLAEIELGAGAPEAALRWADRGLAEGEGTDVFTANLHIARGRAHEALGRDREAVDDYFHALEMNETLLRRTLEAQ